MKFTRGLQGCKEKKEKLARRIPKEERNGTKLKGLETRAEYRKLGDEESTKLNRVHELDQVNANSQLGFVSRAVWLPAPRVDDRTAILPFPRIIIHTHAHTLERHRSLFRVQWWVSSLLGYVAIPCTLLCLIKPLLIMTPDSGKSSEQDFRGYYKRSSAMLGLYFLYVCRNESK